MLEYWQFSKEVARMRERSSIRALPGLLLLMVLVPLDQTALTPALPEIAGDLGGLQLMPMVVTAYVVAVTAALPVYGVLGDRFGRKRMLLIALAMFVLGALACALATSFPLFVAARVMQGIGGGGLMVGAQAALGEIVSPRERGRYLGLFGVAYVVPAVVGPLVGGLLVDAASWRWIFAIHVPLGVIAFILLIVTLRLPRSPEHPRVTFARTVSVLRRRGVLVPILLSFTVGFALLGTISYVPSFARIGLGMTAVEAGFVVTALMGGAILTMTISGGLIAKTGRYRRYPIAGTAVVAAGALVLGLLGRELGVAGLLGVLFVIGLGVGMVMQVVMLAAQNAADPADIGIVTSSVLFLRQIGATVGVALVGALITRIFVELAPPQVRDVASITPESIATLPTELRELVEAAFAAAVPQAILTVAPLLVASIVLAFLLPALPLRTHTESVTSLKELA
ncbi:MFS transporter [Micropruina sonneratiae]|uniref:MFS transporter n=1 Tax=Micropruina sonneratiae TaxID=2986940 RepID=UPI0022275E3E|nr:MFS transporter [Micropruina sp. KQZ13P-5]MCW3159586.1 MFS transporter [Micropruina sp. KQZ13P-5]